MNRCICCQQPGNAHQPIVMLNGLPWCGDCIDNDCAGTYETGYSQDFCKAINAETQRRAKETL